MSISMYKSYGMPTLFNEFHNGVHRRRHRQNASNNCCAPAVDIRETADVLSFEFELPGVKKDEITLEYKEGVLTLSGEKKDEASDEETRYFTRERRKGTFSRSFRIGDGYDPTTVAAKHADGILTVTVTKKEEAKPLSIEVQ
jgi:HSP20 family protein